MRASLIAAIVAALIGYSAHGAAQAAARRATSIPPQELSLALRALMRERELQMVYGSDLLKDQRSHGASGELTIDEALTQILSGTGLTYRYVDERTITLLLATAGQAGAPGPAPAGAEQKSEEIEIELEVIVTGTRLRREELEGPSPVLVISREDIERSGAATTSELLNKLSQNAVARDQSGNGTILGASTIQLRGLPFGTTLLLLNGRRLGASAATVSGNFFDLNNIPLGAVERIEVLTDSASAVYGADAIGGAVNVVLRQAYDGVGAGLRYGTSGEGDATERSVSVTAGAGDEGLSGLLVLDAFDRDPLFASDRPLTSTFDFRRFGGPDARSALSYPANVYSLDFDPDTFETLPLPGLASTFAAVPSGTDGVGLTIADFQATQGTVNLFDPAPFATVVAEAERQTAYASGRYSFSPALRVSAEGLYTHRDQIVWFPPDNIPFGEFGVVSVPAENPFNPFGVPVGVDYRFVELGREANDSTTEFSRWLLAAEGEFLARFDWQVYALADREHTQIFNRGVVDLEAVQASLLQDTDPQTALNVFSTTGNNNPATLAGILGQTTDDLTARAQMGEAVVRGTLFDLPGGALNAALGVNVRRERVDFSSPAIASLRADRDSEAAFAELSVPLVGAHQAIRGIHSLELTAALRHDRYVDVASLDSTTPQFGVAWRPLASLLLRSSYGEAFKAPTVFNLFFPRVSFDAAAFDPLRGGEFTFFPAFFAGNPELQPEEGESFTAGFIWTPQSAPGLSLTVNAFRLEQTHFITTLGIDQLISNPDLFPGRVERAAPAPGDPPGFAGRILAVNLSSVNFGGLTVRGADLQFQYTLPATAVGQFASTLSGTYIDEYEIQLVPGAEPSNEVGRANAAGYPTRFKGSAGLSWSGRGGWTASATVRYLASYLDYDGVRELPAQTWLDAQAVYRFGEQRDLGWLDGLETTLGVVNLTDEQGDFSNNFNNTVGYDSQQADLRGRFFYVSLKAKF